MTVRFKSMELTNILRIHILNHRCIMSCVLPRYLTPLAGVTTLLSIPILKDWRRPWFLHAAASSMDPGVLGVLGELTSVLLLLFVFNLENLDLK